MITTSTLSKEEGADSTQAVSEPLETYIIAFPQAKIYTYPHLVN